jgi:hypothetical protein
MTSWLGLLLQGVSTLLMWIAAVGVVLGGLLVFDPPWQNGVGLAAASAVVGGVAWLARWAGRRLGQAPEDLVLARAKVGAFGLRLTIAAAGMGLFLFGVLAEHSLPDRLFLLATGGFLLSLVGLLLVGDIRLRWGRPLLGRPPGGRPAGVEWALVVIFNGLSATVLTAGVSDLRARGSVDLLGMGVLWAVVGLVASTGVVARWWRNRSLDQHRS